MFLSPAGKTRTSLSVDNDDVEGEKSGYKKAEESRKLTNNNHLPSELTNSTKTGVPTSVSFHHLLTCPIASCPAQAYSCPSANSSQSPFLFDSGLFIIPRPFSLEPSTSSPPTNSGTSRYNHDRPRCSTCPNCNVGSRFRAPFRILCARLGHAGCRHPRYPSPSPTRPVHMDSFAKRSFVQYCSAKSRKRSCQCQTQGCRRTLGNGCNLCGALTQTTCRWFRGG